MSQGFGPNTFQDDYNNMKKITFNHVAWDGPHKGLFAYYCFASREK